MTIQDDLWLILRSQPGIGILIVDEDGKVLFSNDQAVKIYYGQEFNPVGLTIAEIEGEEFASERMQVIQEVIDTQEPRMLTHIRGGKYTEAVIWPLETVEDRKSRVMAICQQPVSTPHANAPYPCFTSQLVDLGPLDVLTKRELEVLALIGHGVPLKTVAVQLGVAQRTVERYRTDIARKLRFNSIAEAARIVQIAGLKASDAALPRLHRWRQPQSD